MEVENLSLYSRAEISRQTQTGIVKFSRIEEICAQLENDDEESFFSYIWKVRILTSINTVFLVQYSPNLSDLSETMW
jgi:hypothetical protein